MHDSFVVFTFVHLLSTRNTSSKFHLKRRNLGASGWTRELPIAVTTGGIVALIIALIATISACHTTIRLDLALEKEGQMTPHTGDSKLDFLSGGNSTRERAVAYQSRSNKETAMNSGTILLDLR